MDIKREVQAIEQEVIGLRRDFHRYPELGFQEARTAGIIRDYLKALRIDDVLECSGTGTIGILKGGMNVVLLPQTQQKIILGFVLLISLITFEIIAWRETRVKGKARLAAHNAS